MARAAFLMDRPMRALGLSGRSFIPLLLGFGCSVPAALSARSMRGERDRRFTLLMIPAPRAARKCLFLRRFRRFFPAARG